MKKYSNQPNPIKLNAPSPGEAWMYRNKGSLEVFISCGGSTLYCRIPKRKILDWLKKTGDL